MGLLLLVPGLILLVTDGWFDQQHDVGWVLTGIGSFLILVQLAIVLAAGWAVSKTDRNIRRRW